MSRREQVQLGRMRLIFMPREAAFHRNERFSSSKQDYDDTWELMRAEQVLTVCKEKTKATRVLGNVEQVKSTEVDATPAWDRSRSEY
ncbi:hypothetical protein ABVT39_011477 [Epinephelus coioides]